MDRSPPPFFNQGPSAHARLAFFALLAIALLAADSRLSVLAALREGVGTMLYPLQRTLLVPRDLFGMSADYLAEIRRLREENAELRRLEAGNAKTLQQAEQLALENARLRELLEARERVAVRSVMAEVLYEPRDPYTRKAVIDRGLQHGLLAGQPVIDARGVIGQVTRVLPLSSEVTLLTDRSAAIPVEVQRTGQRSVAFGGLPSGLLELRFLSAASDLAEGDTLVTSGLDGIYPPGLAVGSIERIESAASSASAARVLVRPTGGLDRSRILLVLLVDRSALPPPPPPEKPADPRHRRARQ